MYKIKSNDPFTRLTIEQSDNKYIWETPFEDINIEDILDALNGLLVSMTFPQNTIYPTGTFLNE